MAVSGNHYVCTSGERGGDDFVVVGIVWHNTGND